MIVAIYPWLLFALGGFALAAPPAATTVEYRFRVERAGSGAVRLDVTLAMRGDASGHTTFAVPSSWAGQDSLRKAIVALDVNSAATIRADSGGILELSHAPGARLTIHYVLQQDWTGELRNPMYHRVILDSTRAILNGQNGLIYPQLDDGAPLDLHYRWDGLPAGWLTITSFGNALRGVARTTSRELINGNFAAGAFRTLRTAPGANLKVVTAGPWRFSDSAYVRLQQAVWLRELAFWKDAPFATGFVVLIPMGQRGSVGGTAFTAGFLEFADTASDLGAVVRVATHEMLHFWNGHRMHGGAPEGRYKWFTEGFTDYYADRFFRDAGGVSDSTYRGLVNRTIRDYFLSPANGSTRDDVATRYWSDPDTRTYPYRQGYVLGIYLQSELIRRTGGKFDFDALIRRTYAAATKGDGQFSDSLLVESAPVAVRSFVSEAIAAHIDRGEKIPLVATTLDQCGVAEPTAIYPFDLGFDVTTSTRDHIAHGVVPDGAAANAGLKEGMALGGWGWFNGDATKEATLRITEQGVPRTLKFLPRGRTPATLPQFVRRDADSSCR